MRHRHVSRAPPRLSGGNFRRPDSPNDDQGLFRNLPNNGRIIPPPLPGSGGHMNERTIEDLVVFGRTNLLKIRGFAGMLYERMVSIIGKNRVFFLVDL